MASSTDMAAGRCALLASREPEVERSGCRSVHMYSTALLCSARRKQLPARIACVAPESTAPDGLARGVRPKTNHAQLSGAVAAVCDLLHGDL